MPANEIIIPTIIMLTVTLGANTVGAAPGVMLELGDDAAVGSVLVTTGGWTLLTAVNLMLFTLLHNPCSTTVLTIWKETRSVALDRRGHAPADRAGVRRVRVGRGHGPRLWLTPRECLPVPGHGQALAPQAHGLVSVRRAPRNPATMGHGTEDDPTGTVEQDRAERMASTLQAIADPVRLQALATLRQGSARSTSWRVRSASRPRSSPPRWTG